MNESRPAHSIEDYDYPLPEEKIAHQPLERGSARLLVAGANSFYESTYNQLAECLPENSWLVFNQTKVVQARLLFPKNERTLIEVFCLEPAEEQSVEQAMQRRQSITYRCLVGGAKKWKSGPLVMEGEHFRLQAEKAGRLEGDFLIQLSWDGDHSFGEILELAGRTPLPPYIQREVLPEDQEHYQTVFARQAGSVAAPTAGLHFHKGIFERLQQMGIAHSFLTLHVGAGTFRPVLHSQVAEHAMHAEEIHLKVAFLEELIERLREKRKIIPVGTTSLRAIESSYWLGRLLRAGQLDLESVPVIPQWSGFASELPLEEPLKALEYLREVLRASNRDALRFKTQLMIAPGYQHRIISGLITNFHQPRSTLLLLVASLMGPRWKEMYDYALEENFRFLSYGDGCLILPYDD